MRPILFFFIVLVGMLSISVVNAQTCNGSTFTPPATPTSFDYNYTGTGATGWLNASGIPIAAPPTTGTGNCSISVGIFADLSYNFCGIKDKTFYVAPAVTFTGSSDGFKNCVIIIEGTAILSGATPATGGTSVYIYATGTFTWPGIYAISSGDVTHNAGVLNIGSDLTVSSTYYSYIDSLTFVSADVHINGDYNNCGLLETLGDVHTSGVSNFNNDCASYIHGSMFVTGDYTNVGLMYFEGNVNLVGPTIFYNAGIMVFYDLLLSNDDIVGIGDRSVIIARNTATLTNGATITNSYFYNSSASPPAGGGFNSVCGNCSLTDVHLLIQAIVPNTAEEILADCGENVIIDGPYPKATLDFDGVDDYLTTPNFIEGTTDVTLMAWVKSDAGNSTHMTIAGEDKGCRLALVSGKTPRFIIKTGVSSIEFVSATAAINLDEWHHITGTFSTATGIIKIYVDGDFSNSFDIGATGSVITNTAESNGKFEIGRKSTSSGSEYFKGDIDEVRVFDTVLTDDQIQRMVYQEIEENSGYVRGSVLPKDIVDISTSSKIAWTNLKAYYPMTDIISYERTSDFSTSGRKTYLKNITSIQTQTAPLPYETKSDGAWTTEGTWLHGDVWDIEDVANNKDCSIVEIKNNVTTSGSHTNLGLFIESGKTLTVNDDNEINNTWYLELDGTMDLEGESQLVQGIYSDLEVTSAGVIERDQQGTKDLFTYNYWSSPVGASNTTTNNNSICLNNNILKNGTVPVTPNNITFLTSGHNGSVSGTDISIADYWVWKYANLTSDSYSSWQHVRSTGTLQAGQGFTMKGVESSENSFTSLQNYVFNGKPNNGTITLNMSAGNDYLVGNPYPSAIDADEFIKDNLGVTDGGNNVAGNIINGSLYFWDHFANNTHNLKEYEGGYATYTLMGGVPAVSNDIRITASGQIGTKTPSQFIPVGQGFFVSSILDASLIGGTNDPGISQPIVGGDITFKNSQRIFKTEATDPSVFFRASQTSTESTNVDDRQKIRLTFDSPDGYHRQLLVGVDETASNNFDLGYDAPLIEDNKEDMFWSFMANKFVIQGVNHFNKDQVLPLGIKINKEGIITIKIEELENINPGTNIYVHDKELDSYHKLNNTNYEMYLTVGEYLDRFEITFEKNTNALSIEESDYIYNLVYYNNSEDKLFALGLSTSVDKLLLINMLGQTTREFADLSAQELNNGFALSNLSSGTYIVYFKTETDTVIKKIIIS